MKGLMIAPWSYSCWSPLWFSNEAWGRRTKRTRICIQKVGQVYLASNRSKKMLKVIWLAEGRAAGTQECRMARVAGREQLASALCCAAGTSEVSQGAATLWQVIGVSCSVAALLCISGLSGNIWGFQGQLHLCSVLQLSDPCRVTTNPLSCCMASSPRVVWFGGCLPLHKAQGRAASKAELKGWQLGRAEGDAVLYQGRTKAQAWEGPSSEWLGLVWIYS